MIAIRNIVKCGKCEAYAVVRTDEGERCEFHYEGHIALDIRTHQLGDR